MDDTQSGAGHPADPAEPARLKLADKPSPRPRLSSGQADPVAGTRPPRDTARKMARRTWWLPWALGTIAVGIAAITVPPLFGADDEGTGWQDVELPTSTHEVTYEITGVGKSPEIKYVADGVAETETVEGAELPWRKELSVEVGPSVGIVQVMATNTGKSSSISCSIIVDGTVVHRATAPGEFSTVSCSSVIRPAG